MGTAEAELREKNRITLVSVGAALVLTVLKLVAGLLTGSLGLLSEAAHSGLDLIASVITYFSVRVAGRPADVEHPYGHGRVENLAAVVQGLLLLGTAAAIIYESVRRILFETVEVQATAWAFGVMGTSIVVDLWRSRMLSRAARRYQSRAMEADALNFRADMFSSAVVILGLALTTLGGGGLLGRADALAALVVALVIVAMSGRLALRGVSVLLDRAPTTLQERMTRAAASVPGVVNSQPVRLRESGNRLFADITVAVPRTTSLAEAHTITEQVESSIRGVAARTETVVHVEPAVAETESAAEAIRAVAQRMGARTHHEQVYRIGDRLEASLHVEVEPELTLREAHQLADRLETALREDNGRLSRVDTHIEVAEPHPSSRRDVTAARRREAEAIKQAVLDAGLGARCHEVRLYRSYGPSTAGHDATLHCDFPPVLPMGEVHKRTELLEQELRNRFPNLERVVIHSEPRDDDARDEG